MLENRESSSFNTEETDLIPYFVFSLLLLFFFFGLRVHAVLPARSASPCARSRAAPVERTAAAVVAKPRREPSREEPREPRPLAPARGQPHTLGISLLPTLVTLSEAELLSGESVTTGGEIFGVQKVRKS